MLEMKNKKKPHSTHSLTKKLTTEKCKQQANQPEKKILKIKILWKFSLEYLSRNGWKKYYFIERNVCFKVYLVICRQFL